MSKHGVETNPEDLKKLLDTYKNQGDFGQKSMKKSHPHVDFDRLLADEKSRHRDKTMDAERISNHFKSSKSEKLYKESGWVEILRILAWVICVVGIISGIYSAYQLASTMNTWTGQTDFAVGLFLVVLAVSLFGTFLLTAVIMVFLDIAADVSITKQSNLDILKILKQNSNTANFK